MLYGPVKRPLTIITKSLCDSLFRELTVDTQIYTILLGLVQVEKRRSVEESLTFTGREVCLGARRFGVPKKYEFTGEVNLAGLKRIRRISSGVLGGWLKGEHNLSQTGNAWASGNAQVSGKAHVSGNARVSDNAWVSDNAKVSGNAWVYGNAQVFGDARVSDNAWVSGIARLFGKARADRDPLVITGLLPWTVTAAPGWASIGCIEMDATSWLSVAPSEIAVRANEELPDPNKIEILRNLLKAYWESL